MEPRSQDVLTVPLFPLPSTVLFPEVRASFFIFEPRYRTMLSDVLDGPGLLGIPQILPGFEGSHLGTPPLCRILGVGRVADYAARDDGTSFIEVQGLYRAALEEELPAGAYRTARVRILPDEGVDPEEEPELRRMLSDAVLRVLKRTDVPGMEESVDRLIHDPELPYPHVLHSLVTVLIGNRRTRQDLLEVPELVRRTRLFVESLHALPPKDPPGPGGQPSGDP